MRMHHEWTHVTGVLSMAQLFLDGAATGDFSNIFGNPVKLGLAVVSIVYDVIFCLQHYVWYRSSHEERAELRASPQTSPGSRTQASVVEFHDLPVLMDQKMGRDSSGNSSKNRRVLQRGLL